MSIHAELKMADGRTLKLTDVPVPLPATGGKSMVSVTYPLHAPPGVVKSVVIHGLTGTFRVEIRPLIALGPGETLSVEVGAEDAVPDLSAASAVIMAHRPAQATPSMLQAGLWCMCLQNLGRPGTQEQGWELWAAHLAEKLHEERAFPAV